MTLPEHIRSVLPADTAMAWELLAPTIPVAAYLAGGTAIAVHLGHRVSHDLDFFYHRDAIDLDQLRAPSTPLVRSPSPRAPQEP